MFGCTELTSELAFWNWKREFQCLDVLGIGPWNCWTNSELTPRAANLPVREYRALDLCIRSELARARSRSLSQKTKRKYELLRPPPRWRRNRRRRRQVRSPRPPLLSPSLSLSARLSYVRPCPPSCPSSGSPRNPREVEPSRAGEGILGGARCSGGSARWSGRGWSGHRGARWSGRGRAAGHGLCVDGGVDRGGAALLPPPLPVALPPPLRLPLPRPFLPPWLPPARGTLTRRAAAWGARASAGDARAAAGFRFGPISISIWTDAILDFDFDLDWCNIGFRFGLMQYWFRFCRFCV